MVRKIITIIALSTSLTLAACNAVRGGANDVESVGDCVDGKDNNC
jgi:predicted small secreted protein